MYKDQTAGLAQGCERVLPRGRACFALTSVILADLALEKQLVC